MEDETWIKTHERLQGILKKEIALNRELLGVLHEQENLLFAPNMFMAQKLTLHSNQLTCQLRKESRERKKILCHLFDFLPKALLGRPLQDVLDPCIDIEAETLMLYEQVKMLSYKTYKCRLESQISDQAVSNANAMKMNGFEKVNSNEKKRGALITLDAPHQD